MRCGITIFIFLILFSGCAVSSDKEDNMSDVRKPAVAGSWYPGDADSLERMISSFIDDAEIPDIDDRILGLIAPHAGYFYSGPVAAYAFKALMKNQARYKGNTVILIGFSHRPQLWQGISVWSKGYWETPLGKVSVDEKLAQKIMAFDTGKLQYKPEVHAEEHSLEMEVPFLQYALDNNFKLVPISFANQTLNDIENLVSAILAADIDWNKTIMVVSTDMSHYHPYNDAVSLDQKTLEYVLDGDTEGLLGWMQQGTDAFCGWGAVLTAMLTMQKIGAKNTVLLKYANSGDIQPSSMGRGVVGYCSVAFITGESSSNTDDSGDSSNETAPGTDDYSLNDEQKLYLLKLARNTIETYIKTGKKLEPEKPSDTKLAGDAPVFVTLHSNGMLRGCIGQMIARGPLYLAVRDMAIAASTEDPRFQPVKESELDAIDIEVSVLSPLRKIDSWEEIEPFRHGVYVKQGWRSGVFLPQVWKQIPDKESFLGELCTQKAHLDVDCYKSSDVELYVYTVLEFDEKGSGLK